MDSLTQLLSDFYASTINHATNTLTIVTTIIMTIFHMIYMFYNVFILQKAYLDIFFLTHITSATTLYNFVNHHFDNIILVFIVATLLSLVYQSITYYIIHIILSIQHILRKWSFFNHFLRSHDQHIQTCYACHTKQWINNAIPFPSLNSDNIQTQPQYTPSQQPFGSQLSYWSLASSHIDSQFLVEKHYPLALEDDVVLVTSTSTPLSSFEYFFLFLPQKLSNFMPFIDPIALEQLSSKIMVQLHANYDNFIKKYKFYKKIPFVCSVGHCCAVNNSSDYSSHILSTSSDPPSPHKKPLIQTHRSKNALCPDCASAQQHILLLQRADIAKMDQRRETALLSLFNDLFTSLPVSPPLSNPSNQPSPAQVQAVCAALSQLRHAESQLSVLSDPTPTHPLGDKLSTARFCPRCQQLLAQQRKHALAHQATLNNSTITTALTRVPSIQGKRRLAPGQLSLTVSHSISEPISSHPTLFSPHPRRGSRESIFKASVPTCAVAPDIDIISPLDVLDDQFNPQNYNDLDNPTTWVETVLHNRSKLTIPSFCPSLSSPKTIITPIIIKSAIKPIFYILLAILSLTAQIISFFALIPLFPFLNFCGYSIRALNAVFSTNSADIALSSQFDKIQNNSLQLPYTTSPHTTLHISAELRLLYQALLPPAYYISSISHEEQQLHALSIPHSSTPIPATALSDLDADVFAELAFALDAMQHHKYILSLHGKVSPRNFTAQDFDAINVNLSIFADYMAMVASEVTDGNDSPDHKKENPRQFSISDTSSINPTHNPLFRRYSSEVISHTSWTPQQTSEPLSMTSTVALITAVLSYFSITAYLWDNTSNESNTFVQSPQYASKSTISQDTPENGFSMQCVLRQFAKPLFEASDLVYVFSSKLKSFVSTRKTTTPPKFAYFKLLMHYVAFLLFIFVIYTVSTITNPSHAIPTHIHAIFAAEHISPDFGGDPAILNFIYYIFIFLGIGGVTLYCGLIVILILIIMSILLLWVANFILGAFMTRVITLFLPETPKIMKPRVIYPSNNVAAPIVPDTVLTEYNCDRRCDASSDASSSISHHSQEDQLKTSQTGITQVSEENQNILHTDSLPNSFSTEPLFDSSPFAKLSQECLISTQTITTKPSTEAETTTNEHTHPNLTPVPLNTDVYIDDEVNTLTSLFTSAVSLRRTENDGDESELNLDIDRMFISEKNTFERLAHNTRPQNLSQLQSPQWSQSQQSYLPHQNEHHQSLQQYHQFIPTNSTQSHYPHDSEISHLRPYSHTHNTSRPVYHQRPFHLQVMNMDTSQGLDRNFMSDE